jgi:hypothetical protein
MQLMGLVSRSYAEATWSVMTLALQCTENHSTNRLNRVRIRRRGCRACEKDKINLQLRNVMTRENRLIMIVLRVAMGIHHHYHYPSNSVWSVLLMDEITIHTGNDVKTQTLRGDMVR